jgi:hypothetical protein
MQGVSFVPSPHRGFVESYAKERNHRITYHVPPWHVPGQGLHADKVARVVCQAQTRTMRGGLLAGEPRVFLFDCWPYRRRTRSSSAPASPAPG